MDINQRVHYRKCPMCQYLIPQRCAATTESTHCLGCHKVPIKHLLPCDEDGRVFKAKQPIKIN